VVFARTSARPIKRKLEIRRFEIKEFRRFRGKEGAGTKKRGSTTEEVVERETSRITPEFLAAFREAQEFSRF